MAVNWGGSWFGLWLGRWLGALGPQGDRVYRPELRGLTMHRTDVSLALGAKDAGESSKHSDSGMAIGRAESVLTTRRSSENFSTRRRGRK